MRQRAQTSAPRRAEQRRSPPTPDLLADGPERPPGENQHVEAIDPQVAFLVDKIGVHVLNEDVLPFFEAYQARIHTVLSDNWREFCGRLDAHPYELFLQLEGIDHRKTQVRRPQSNGLIERLHRTLLDEHFRIQGRTKWYEALPEMQADLDAYFTVYNKASKKYFCFLFLI